MTIIRRMTQAPPDKPGYYWAVVGNDIEPVQIAPYPTSGTRLVVFILGFEVPIPIDQVKWWGEAIEVPDYCNLEDGNDEAH